MGKHIYHHFQKHQSFGNEEIQMLASMVVADLGCKAFTVFLTLMVTLMALFMLPLHSQPCLEMPPFWDPREAVSCRAQRKEMVYTINSPDGPMCTLGEGKNISVSLDQQSEIITRLF